MSTSNQTSSFTENLLIHKKKLREEAKIKVLVWGPGSQDSNGVYKKRCEIRDKIISLGHDAYFSEDISLPDSGLNLCVEELIEAYSCDYIVCLMASQGSIGEFHDLPIKHASKTMICIDQKYKNGYSGRGKLRIFEGKNGKLDWYLNPQDLDECHLATRVIEQIEKTAEAKQFQLVMRGSS